MSKVEINEIAREPYNHIVKRVIDNVSSIIIKDKYIDIEFKEINEEICLRISKNLIFDIRLCL